MTNKELNALRMRLQEKRMKLEGAISPLTMMGDIKAAAAIASEITEELTRRELNRQEVSQ